MHLSQTDELCHKHPLTEDGPATFSFKVLRDFIVIERDVTVLKDIQVWKNHRVQPQVQEVDAKPHVFFVVVLFSLYCELPQAEQDLKTLLHVCVRTFTASKTQNSLHGITDTSCGNKREACLMPTATSSRTGLASSCAVEGWLMFFYSHLSKCLLYVTFWRSVMATESVEKVTLQENTFWDFCVWESTVRGVFGVLCLCIKETKI